MGATFPKAHPWRYAQKCSACGGSVRRGAWAGLCATCDEKRKADASRVGFASRYHARKRAGLCVRCGQARPASAVECDVCAETRRVRDRWRLADKRKSDALDSALARKGTNP